MDPVTALGIAGTAVQLVEQTLRISDCLYQYFKSVKNAPAKSRELRQEALLLSDVLETLAALFSAQNKPTVLPNSGKYADVLQEFKETMAEMAKKVEIKKGKLSFKRLAWPFNERENEKYLARMERFKGSFQLAVQALQSSKLDNIELLARRIDHTVQRSHQLNTDTFEQKRQEKRLVILNWIYPDEFANRHKEISHVRSNGSGDWFVKSSIYQSWLKCDNTVLFCHGMPGSGKSVVMSRVVDDLTAEAIAYIYFDYNDPKSYQPQNIIRSLLKQILFSWPSLPDGVQEYYEVCLKKGKSADLTSLKQQLLSAIEKSDRVFLLFDALDEISSECSKEVMSLINDFRNTGPKIFCTSRINTARVREELGNPAVIEIRANEDDIAHYITGRLDKEYDYDDESKQKIMDCLVVKADGKWSSYLGIADGCGRFLLVKFQLDYVLDFAEPSESLEALSTVPIDMEEAYRLLLTRIEKRRRATVVKILSWLFRARRPLKQDEIREAIAVRLGAKTLSKPLLHLDSLIQYCQGLVTMDDITEIVRFSHFTVKEFLIAHFQDQLLSPIDCARLCLTYINFEIFEKGACSNKGQYEKRRNEYRFSEYIVMYWGSYAQGEAEYDQQVVYALWTFLESRKKRAAVRQLYRIQSLDPLNKSGTRKLLKVAERYLNTWTPLHIIAHEGLAIFYERYLSNQCPPSVGKLVLGEIDLGTVHSKNEESETPLLLACARGHYDVAKLLIADGAEVMARDSGGETPLHKAAAEGHLGVIKLLLEKGAEVNATTDWHTKWTPLHKASLGGCHQVTKLLLDSGAEINVEDSQQWTPLDRAAFKGHYEVVKVLLDRKAEIHNPKNEFRWSPLHDSASGGHLEVVKLLLDKDADMVNATDSLGRTPLYEAACGGHNAVAKVLLARNANVNAKDGDGETPLHRAALKGDVQLITLLLDGGAAIHARNDEGETALHKAALLGHRDVVALLQDTGADLNARENNGRAALHMAASMGDHDMVKVLLNRHVESFPRDKLGVTPLREAASRGREAIADCNVEKDNFGWIPLQGPSRWGLYVAVISQLCQALPTNNETIESAFTSLVDAFAGDYLFWRTLGNELLRQHMFTEAIQAFDMFARKFLFRTTSRYDQSVGKFVTIKLASNLECLELHALCQKCRKIVRGFHYKCKTCRWDINFCQNCVKNDWTDHEHPPEELLQIPSHWPLASLN